MILSVSPTQGSRSLPIQLQNIGAQLRAQVRQYSSELTTGVSSDPADRVKGELGQLALIESRSRRVESEIQSALKALGTLGATQVALESISDRGGEIRDSVILLINGNVTDADVSRTANLARANLAQMISAFSTSFAGRNIFSGTKSDQLPLPDVDVFLDSVLATMPSDATANEVITAVEAFFDTPGGQFETSLFAGGPAVHLSAVGPGMNVALPTGLHPALRIALREATLVAVMDTPSLFSSRSEQNALAAQVATRYSEAAEGVLSLRGEIGGWEAILGAQKGKLLHDADTQTQARDRLIGVDPFDAATRLEEARARLEALYLVTARVARLSLTEYLR